jgi:hypothetical protein
VSVDTALHGLFWPKQPIWLKPTITSRQRIMQILQGYYEKMNGAARQD